MATLGTLVAGVAHEVKTPLAIIKTRIQMWEKKLRERDDTVNDESVVSRESMKLVIGEINRLAALVKRLLVFSKPLTNTLRTSDINELLRQTAGLVKSEADEKHVTIETHFDNAIPAIQLDTQSMEQVIINILSNSLEAMPNGGHLRIESMHQPDERFVVIHIEDTGNGIQPEIAGKIFNPFFTTKEHGAGLGLSISYEIVHAHHGRIEFVQPNGHGTLCRITLPVDTRQKKTKHER